MSHREFAEDFLELIEKCYECGIQPGAFFNEKRLELEERKRILLTPSAKWYTDNKRLYEDFAKKSLGRDLTESERFGRDEKLSEWVERKIYARRPSTILDSMSKSALLANHNNRCAHCGAALSINIMHIDHILPCSQGGSGEVLNLQPLCRRCNLGKRAFTEDTAQAAARPWFELTHMLLKGKVHITDLKRYCVIIRDGRLCQKCGRSSKDVELLVVLRVGEYDGGQAVYDNLVTVCVDCGT